MGRHVRCLPSQSVIAVHEFSAIFQGLNALGTGVVKISVCLALLRVVERARRRITLFLWSLLVLVATTHLTLTMLFFLHCRPLARLWNPKVNGSCMSAHTMVLACYICSAIDIATDLLCAAIPVLVIHRLQMTFRTKVALCVLMGLGVLTAGCAVAKAITLRGVSRDDYTFGFTEPATWAAVEQFVGIIIASIPALRPLLSSFLERSHNHSSIWRHLFGNGKTSRSTFSKKQRPKTPGSHPHLPESVRMKKTFITCYRDSQRSSTDRIQVSPIHEDASNGYLEVSDPEMGLREDRFDNVQGRDFLKEWSLPDIRDRTSAIISMPVFDI